MTKTALFITYYFPPTGGGGTQRPTKFVRYLQDFGWTPIVLTVKNPAYGIFDETLLEEIPANLKVYRTNAIQPTALYFKLKNRQNMLTSRSVKNHKPILKSKLLKYLRSLGRNLLQFVLLPDDKIGWMPFALRAAHQIVKENPIDLIYTISAPYTAHWIGARLAHHTGLPWVSDYPDPFVADRRIAHPTPLHTFLHKRWEKDWVTTANQVITTSDATSRNFAARYPDLPQSHWVTITTGYDEAEFASIESCIPPDVFELHHLGTLYRQSSPNPEPLLQAIRQLLNEDPQASKEFRLVLTGEMDEAYKEQLYAGIHRWQVGEVVRINPPIPHKAAVQQMVNATALMIVLKDEPSLDLLIHGKTFEYLRAKRPILALVPKGAVYDLLQTMDSACFAHPNDSEAIARQLASWLEQWRGGNLPVPRNLGHERFERRRLTQSLAQVFDNVLIKS